MAAGQAVAPISSETATIRKLRLRILPFVFLLYVVSFLDRINIGFAALTMNKELAITSQQFGFLAGIFFFGYFIFEIPSNLLLHKIGARIWITRILIIWGILATLTGFVRTIHELYALRFLLGLAEAGYFPGIVLYLTYWFRQREQAQAIALFLTGIPFTSIIGAPISGFILDRVHWLNVSSWRWLLVLEGIPAIVCGVLTYFLLPSRPAEAKFLTAAEKTWLAEELAREEQRKRESQHISAVQALAHARVWHHSKHRHVHHDVLAAAAYQVAGRWLLQRRRRPARDPALRCRLGGDGLGLSQLRPHPRAQISRGNSRRHRRRRARFHKRGPFHRFVDRALVRRRPGNLQRLRPVLFTAQRVPHRIRRSFGYRTD